VRELASASLAAAAITVFAVIAFTFGFSAEKKAANALKKKKNASNTQ
jgi:hypothetical protein